MYLTNFAVFAQMEKQQVNLFVQCRKVGFNAFRFRHRHRVTTAIVTQVLAKRHVDVERDVVGRSIVGGFHRLEILFRAKFLKLVGRRIARVARHRDVVFLENCFVHSPFFVGFKRSND